MKKLIIVVTLCLGTCVWAQSFEEQFRSFQQKANTSYSDFRESANAQYADFLRRAWDSYQQSPAIPRPEEKPVPPVIYDKDKEQEEQVITIEVIPEPAPAPSPQPVVPIQENTLPAEQVSVVYQGTSFSFRVPQQRIVLKKIDGESIAQQWQKTATGEYDNLLYDCQQNKQKFLLCDWAYIELIGALCHQLYGNASEAAFLQAYILTQSGYALRLAMQSNKLYVLMGSRYQLYDISYFNIDGINYYPLTSIDGSIQISSANFKGEQPFTLDINVEQGLTMRQAQSPKRESEQGGIVVSSSINLNTILFYNGYPTGQVGNDCGTRWATYANVPMEECVRQSLYPVLQKAIQGLSEEQAVGKILNWVQTAFEYALDDVVWGHDRAFFPSETLYYPYADCEDRAILFSRIVRDLLDLDVVLLYYPGHLASAVAFNNEVKGDYVQLNGVKYTVCDPTYIGAPVGATMTDMNNQTAKLIPLRK